MERTLVAISILLAAAAAAAAEPPGAAPTATEAAESTSPPVDPIAPATAPAAVASEPAAAPTSADAAAAPAKADDSAAAPTADAAEVPTVDIKKLTDDTVCRKERPTGSLIGVMRCYPRSASAAADRNDELMRRDIEEMRMRQNDQQAREAAAAMTRRRVGQ
jgi:hypothetical protein